MTRLSKIATLEDRAKLPETKGPARDTFKRDDFKSAAKLAKMWGVEKPVIEAAMKRAKKNQPFVYPKIS